MPDCLDDEVALRLVEGKLAGGALAGATAHIATCDDCRALVAETAKFYGKPAVGITMVERPASAIGAAPKLRSIGRYAVRGRLGEGGMGVVYLAYDAQLDREVALKLLRAATVSPERLEQSSSRLLREAQAMAKVAHPNVVAVHDAGTFEGQVFVAMEFVAGRTLGGWLKETPRAYTEILEVFVQAGRGLAAAHAARLVHRDFKPDNVLIGHDGRVRVTDFGLACLSRDDDSSEDWAPATRPDASLLGITMTRSGILLGTPAYMAPEQFDGELADAKSDQFSFCVALHEALYGVRPFSGDDLDSLKTSVLANEVIDRPKIDPLPSGLYDVLRRGLRADASERFGAIDELLAALVPFSAPTSAIVQRSPRLGRRIALVTVIALLATVGVLGYRASRTLPTVTPVIAPPIAVPVPQVAMPPAPSPVVEEPQPTRRPVHASKSRANHPAKPPLKSAPPPFDADAIKPLPAH